MRTQIVAHPNRLPGGQGGRGKGREAQASASRLGAHTGMILEARPIRYRINFKNVLYFGWPNQPSSAGYNENLRWARV